MPTCQRRLSSGEPCPKVVEEGKTLCRWHDPEDESWREIYERLGEAMPEDKTGIVLWLIEEHPTHHLELPDRDGSTADLFRVDLSFETLRERIQQLGVKETPWWSDGIGAHLMGAELRGARLSQANLKGTYLSASDFRGAKLLSANLQDAELSSSNFERADLSGANLRSAHLLSANLRGASLTVADLQYAHLDHANLQGANLVIANLHGADLSEADLQGANLLDANLLDARLLEVNLQNADLEHAELRGAHIVRADLQNAVLSRAKLEGANLSEANLQGANLECATLRDADLRKAKLQGIDLSCASDISTVYISDAWLDRTRVRREQFGGEIGEERDRDYSAAKRGYVALKQNFDDLGDYDAASWAYRKERRMEKLEARGRGRSAFLERRWSEAISSYFKFTSDLIVEWLCDYGESVWRVIGWMAILLFLGGPLMFSKMGGFVWHRDLLDSYFALSSPWLRFWYNYRLYLIYTLDALTTASFSGLQPSNDVVKIASGLFAITGIVLAGLLGFVAGNRIRRS